ncbi:MAG: phage tail protein [Acidimicrobiia bacterium]
MAAQKPGTFDKKAFMDAVKKAIEAASPKNLKEVTEFSESGKAGEVKDKVAGMVTQNKEAAEEGIKEKTEAEPHPSKGEAKEVTPMSDEKPGPKPGPVGAAAAMPPPATAAEVNLEKGPADINKEMAEEDVTEDQLRESNEPEMIQAADANKEAEKHSAEAPTAYRTEEASILGAAKGKAQQAAVTGVGGMHASKVGALLEVASAKSKTKSADETKRAKVATDMEAIYGKTKTDVTKILDGIELKVTKAFETGEKNARQAFESFVEAKMSAYKDERYSGLRGKARWIRDKFRGMPDAVNQFYEQGKSLYLTAMDGVISKVADVVDKDLTAARNRIAQGQVEIRKYVASLPKDLKQVGKEAAEEIGEKFKQLEGDVDSKQEELVSTIANKYLESRDALDKRIEALKEANKGLIDKAIGFVKGAIDTIRKLKDLLLTVLRKAISVITDIIRHPIRFIENFMSGVKDGLNLFTDKIGDYLESALIGWLFGPSVLGGRQIEKPDSLDFKGIVSLVLQVLGLTKDAILDLLRNKVGAPAVEKLKQSVAWVTMVATEGPGGLWKWIQEKAGDLYDTVIGGIKDFVVTRIIRAGITWLISLLNPAGALVKIVKAIVDVVTFIFERAAQIADFINAILDAVIAVAKGNMGGVAKKIADGLGKGLSLAIGFLASLLGLGGIGETVRGIIGKVRAPIKRVVNGLIDGAVRQARHLWGGVKAAGKFVGVGKDNKAGADKDKPLAPDVQKRWDEGMAAVDVLVTQSSAHPLKEKEIASERRSRQLSCSCAGARRSCSQRQEIHREGVKKLRIMPTDKVKGLTTRFTQQDFFHPHVTAEPWKYHDVVEVNGYIFDIQAFNHRQGEPRVKYLTGMFPEQKYGEHYTVTVLKVEEEGLPPEILK